MKEGWQVEGCSAVWKEGAGKAGSAVCGATHGLQNGQVVGREGWVVR